MKCPRHSSLPTFYCNCRRTRRRSSSFKPLNPSRLSSLPLLAPTISQVMIQLFFSLSLSPYLLHLAFCLYRFVSYSPRSLVKGRTISELSSQSLNVSFSLSVYLCPSIFIYQGYAVKGRTIAERYPKTLSPSSLSLSLS